MNHYTITVGISTTRSEAEIRETIADLLTDAAAGHVGDPTEQPLYGASVDLLL